MVLKNIVVAGAVFLSGCAYAGYRVKDRSIARDFKRPNPVVIAVIPMLDRWGGGNFDATFAASGQFLKAGYKVVDRAKVEAILNEQAFQSSGAVEKGAARIGKIAGANLVLAGTFSKQLDYYPYFEESIYLRLIDVETNEVVATACCFGTNIRTVDLVPCAARELVKMMERKHD